MRRKITEKLLEWKQNRQGESALLIEGARRVGKSYIVEAFAKEAYRSYILIDFNSVSEDIRRLFRDYRGDLDMLFMYLNSQNTPTPAYWHCQ